MTQEEAIQAWNDRIYDNQEVRDYLDDDTWHGVAIAFFIGCGFSLNEAIALLEHIEY